MDVRHYDWLARHAARTPDKLAAVDLASGRRFTYGEFNGRAGRLAHFLARGAGVGRGDRVGALSHNSTDLFEMQFACAKLGAVFVPFTWRLTAAELESVVGDSAPKVVFHDPEFAETLHGLQKASGAELLVETNGLGQPSPYEDAIATADEEATAVENTHGDTWTILYTSGTTGRPKGAMLTYGVTFYNAINATVAARITSDSVNLDVLPLFHTAGLNLYANPVFHAGGTVLVGRTFDPGEVLAMIGGTALGITLFHGVPAHFLFMSQHADFESTDFSHLELAAVGGAPIAVSLLEVYAARGLDIAHAYGMTEVGPCALMQPLEDVAAKRGPAGKPVMHVEARIVDPEGQDVTPGDIGELWFKGPIVVPGYWRRPDADAGSFTDGWLHTGDAARVDEDGDYHIVDRWKDMYISGGENVYPVEVENALAAHPAIFEAAVISRPDARWGEVGHAIVRLIEEKNVTAEEITGFCGETLARYKIPKSVEFTGDALPRTASGKLLKRQLRDERGF